MAVWVRIGGRLPKASPFNYVIKSYYAPKGYYLFKDKYRKPWSIMLRILPVDLPHQLKDTDTCQPVRWEHEACNDTGDEKEMDRRFDAPETLPETLPETTSKHPGVPWRDHAPPNTQQVIPLVSRQPVGRTCADSAPGSGDGASCFSPSRHHQDGKRTSSSSLRMCSAMTADG
jgi:hypothetical protein